MEKITDNTLNSLAEAGEIDDVRLRVVDDGMRCEVRATVQGSDAPRVLHTRRGHKRHMNPQTALQYVRSLGRGEVVVELEPEDGR